MTEETFKELQEIKEKLNNACDNNDVILIRFAINQLDTLLYKEHSKEERLIKPDFLDE